MANRFADGAAADAHLQGDLRLLDPLAGLNVSVQYGFPLVVGDFLAQGDVGLLFKHKFAQ
jgi:hypothetical protein